MRTFTGKCKSIHEALVAYFWERGEWVPAHQLDKLELSYAPKGYIGNSGEVRARELARNECVPKLMNKVELAEGRDLGLDKRFVYFRYK